MAKRFFTPIQFDTSSTGTPSAGQVNWDADFGTMQVGLAGGNVTLQVGQEHLVRVKNNSASVAIPNGTAVMFAGATGDTIKVSPAISTSSYEPYTLVGITTEEIPADGFGFVTQYGFVNNVNTGSYTLGDLLYVDPATPGALTKTAPAAPNWTFPIAAVTKVNASSGRILVRAIPGGHLNDIVDVAISSIANNDIIKYDSTSGTWKNDNPLDVVKADTTYSTTAYFGSATATGTTSATVTLPANMIEGDVVFLFVASSNNTISNPTGYTLIDSSAVSTNFYGAAFYKAMGSTPDTSVTVNASGISTNGLSVVAYVVRNASVDNPVSNYIANTSTTGMPNPNNIYTVYPNQLVLAVGLLDNDALSGVTAPTSYSDLAWVSQNGTNDSTAMVASRLISAAGTNENPAAFGYTGSPVGSDNYVAYSIAVAPSGSIGNLGTKYVATSRLAPISALTSTSGKIQSGYLPAIGNTTAQTATTAAGDIYSTNIWVYTNSSTSASLVMSGITTTFIGAGTNAAGTGGSNLVLYGGSASSTAGTAILTSGGFQSSADTGTTGTTTITTGAAISSSNQSTGAISIDTGAPQGTGVAGAVNVGTTNASSVSISKSGTTTTVNGALTVAGSTSLNGGFSVDSTAFSVADVTGNTSIAGTLDVTGNTTLTGDIAVNGGDVTSTSATVNLFVPAVNTAVTELNIATGTTGSPTARTVNINTGLGAQAIVNLGGGTGGVVAGPVIYRRQATPTAKTGSATLTIAELLTGIITVTSATAVNLTVPTGTNIDAGILGGTLANDYSFDWTVINLGSSSGAISFITNTGHTWVGSASLAINNSATYRTRKTASNTFVTYRIT